jgi:uncharacterized protein YcnI
MRRLWGALLILSLVSPVAAHIDLEPRQSIPKRWETYTLRIPTETTAPTVKIEVRVPAGFEIETIAHSRAWQISTTRDERGHMREITWSGGAIPPQRFEELKFLARNPATPGLYTWNMTQHYREGEPGTWTAQTQILPASNQGSQRAEEAWRSAQTATTVSLIALGIALTLILVTLLNIWQSGRRPRRDADL